MPNLYIGNCTKQDQDFAYRVEKDGKLILQKVPIGRQIKLSGDLNGGQIAYIVQQHQKYGFVSVREIDRSRPFIGLCYDEKPIPVEKLREALAHNDRVMTDRGRKTREEAAVAAHQAVEQQLEGAADIDKLELTIEEVQKDTTEGKPLEESVVVDTKADQARTETTKKPGGDRSESRPKGRKG